MIEKKLGWIALDIDGTITVEKCSVPQEVIAYLRSLQKQGWNIAMATGRSYTFARMALSQFDFPYVFLPQNGSVALQMPEGSLLFKQYLSLDVVPLLEQAFVGTGTDFLIYTGYEKGDIFYWRPDRHSEESTRYLKELSRRQKEVCEEVTSFDQLPLSSFPLAKCFGKTETMQLVASRLLATSLFQIARIQDPFTKGNELLLITDRKASKGSSLLKVLQMLGRGACVIAAGDDENDISLLEVADIGITMPHAPPQVKEKATLIAPPPEELGIITALKQVLHP